MKMVSKELFSDHKLSLPPRLPPYISVTVELSGHVTGIFAVFRIPLRVEFSPFFLRIIVFILYLYCFLFFAGIDSWINIYSPRDFAVMESLRRTSNYICYYRNMSPSGYGEIKFLRKSFSFLVLKLFSSTRGEITHIGSSTTKCNLEIIRGFSVVVG